MESSSAATDTAAKRMYTAAAQKRLAGRATKLLDCRLQFIPFGYSSGWQKLFVEEKPWTVIPVCWTQSTIRDSVALIEDLCPPKSQGRRNRGHRY